jgi:N6-adenosine-specific RNA methylase IME4
MNNEVAVSQYADRINAAWRQSVNGVIEVGRLLAQAKAELSGDFYKQLVERDLPFSSDTARRLIDIAEDERISAHVPCLPNHWGTLYELTKLDDKQFSAKVNDGTINPDMERRDISQVLKAEKRAARESDLGAKIAALPNKKFGVIYADPPWRFEPYSRETGMDRAANNHYPTSKLDDISELDVPSIAADDCVLFVWATVPMLLQAFEVMDDWGFEYRSHFVWAKDRVGTGYWNRNAHELLLVGVKGNIPAPAPGTQSPSLIEGRVGKHSAKPECFLEMIEAYFPTLPKIELYRRGLSRKGWAAWGQEAEETAA